MFLTDLLFNSPRMKFSQAQQKAVLLWGKELGAEGVPVHSKLRSMQQDVLAEVGNPTTRYETSQGRIFYLNEIGDSIAKVRCFKLTL